MQANSELEDICEDPDRIVKSTPEKEFGYYESSVLSHHHESIEDLINENTKINDISEFKGFNMIGHDSHLDSNVNLVSNQNEWKVESINFSESKPIKTLDKFKGETNDDMCLLKVSNPPVSFIDKEPW